jgi:hypothetical protein
MQSRNDQPNIGHFNFGVDNPLNNLVEFPNTGILPPPFNKFLLLDTEDFMLLSGQNFVLLGS